MSIFETDQRVVLYRNRDMPGGTQILYRRYKIFGKCIWKTEIDREEYPAWAAIQAGCLGSTDWKSKFLDIINNQRGK